VSDSLRDVSDTPQEATEILVEGFFDNPFMAWIFQADDTRRQALREWYDFWIRCCADESVVQITNDAMGATFWAQPGYGGLRDDEGSRLVDLIRRYNGDRTGHVLQHVAPLGEHPTTPHWYLNSIAVRPEGRSKGIGGLLLEPMLERAKSEELPVYLESSNPRNLSFYYRYGFEAQRDAIQLPDGGPSVLPMIWHA
jgi:GNAT superfamily N-acetyltransferase